MIRPSFLLPLSAFVASALALSATPGLAQSDRPANPVIADAAQSVADHGLDPVLHTLDLGVAQADALEPAEATKAVTQQAGHGKHGVVNGVESDLIPAPDYSMVAAKLPAGALIEVRRAAPLATNRALETDSVEIWGDEQYAFSPWYELEVEADKFPGPGGSEQPGDRNITDVVWVEPGTAIQVRVAGAQLDEVQLTLVDTERADASEGERVQVKARKQMVYDPAPIERDNQAVLASKGAPHVITRKQWGADETLVRSAPGYAQKIERAVVHHTSGSNGYTKSQSASIVRGILTYHAVTRGWSDIGYNFLVDKYGQIFEGRAGGVGRGVIGAHAQGFNTGTVGISTLGTYNAAAPSAAAQTAIAQIIGWKGKIHGFDPTGRSTVTSGGSNRYSAGTQVTLNRVIGHRDVGFTDCPGDSFYPLMSKLASKARSHMGTLSGVKEIDPYPPFAEDIRIDPPQDGSGTTKPTPKPTPKPTSTPRPRPSASSTPKPIDPGIFERLSTGGSKAAAAVAISRYTFKDKQAEIAVIAREDNFADAMSGGPLAGKRGPLLLTNTRKLSSETLTELKRVLAKNPTIYVLGGTAAVSEDVAKQLGSLGTVKRLRGSGRVETSAAIAREVLAHTASSQIMIAREGPDDKVPWADALAGGAWGAAYGVPVLLTNSTKLSPQVGEVIKTNRIAKVHLLGGTGALADSVKKGLPRNVTVQRHSGKDRTETATVVATALWGSDVDSLVLANGFDKNAWVWALAAAPLSAKTGSPLLLSGSDQPSPALTRWAGTHKIRNAVALGDKKLLSDRLLTDLISGFRR